MTANNVLSSVEVSCSYNQLFENNKNKGYYSEKNRFGSQQHAEKILMTFVEEKKQNVEIRIDQKNVLKKQNITEIFANLTLKEGAKTPDLTIYEKEKIELSISIEGNKDPEEIYKRLSLLLSPSLQQLLRVGKSFLPEAIEFLGSQIKIKDIPDLTKKLEEFLMIKRYDYLIDKDRPSNPTDTARKNKLFIKRSRLKIDKLMQNYKDEKIQKMNLDKSQEWLKERSSTSSTVSGKSVTPVPEEERKLAAENWLKANEYVCELVKNKIPLTTTEICNIHRILAKDLPNNGGIAGILRSDGINCGKNNYLPGNIIEEKLNEFFDWLKSQSHQLVDPIERAALAYQRLVSIHPFSDGNGRLCRFAMDYVLQSSGYPPALLTNDDVSVAVFAELDDDDTCNVHPLEAILRVSKGVERSLEFINS